MDRLLDSSLTELSALVHKRAISPTELVDAHIRRIEQVNPSLNALVAHRFEDARKEARKAEAQLMNGGGSRPPPLLGIPCTIKEFIGVTGMPQTAGLLSRRHVRATEDAELVCRLRRAGAIILGVTNVPEGGLWLETYNRVYGRTNNPWNLRHTSGGSSGGEAALLACGGSVFGIGSDVGGSIRIPAAFCGVVGHKPSGRLVPNGGHWPRPNGDSDAYLACGPLTRRVSDILPLLRILAGAQEGSSLDLHQGAEFDVRKLVVYPLESNGRTRVGEDMRGAVRRAADALSRRGARIGEIPSNRLRHAFMIWAAMMAQEADQSYAELLGNGKRISRLIEILKLPLGLSSHTAPALILTLIEGIIGRLPGQVGRLVDAGKRLKAEMEDLLGPHGVLLHPPYSRPAPRHGAPLLTPLDADCTALFNVLENPVTVVPLGTSAKGLPVSVQVIGRQGNDGLTVAVAGLLEEEFGGWVRQRSIPC